MRRAEQTPRRKMPDSEYTAATHALKERVKELTCLYGISQISERFKGTPGKIFADIVALIPRAWQYPEAAIARIVEDGKEYKTASFIGGNRFQKISADIRINQKKRGTVEVAYTKKKPQAAEGPFLKEERNLIQMIARQLAVIIEREQADEEKEKLQKQLMHADRLATIGQLAAGVAHELNEPLGNIIGFSQLAVKHPGLPGQVKKDVDKIVAACLYSREIIKKLLLFARQTPSLKTRINLNTVLSDALGMFEYRFEKEGIACTKMFADNLPAIRADPGQLTQVLVNLVANAIHAMPEGGTLTIMTGSDADTVFFAVADTGVGMTDEVLNRIFVPFFTTKGDAHGTGLGLPVVHGIVTSHEGTIDVESSPGKGSRFTIRLPNPCGSRQRGLVKT
jgi:two-component system NtrC family sensor kinase